MTRKELSVKKLSDFIQEIQSEICAEREPIFFTHMEIDYKKLRDMIRFGYIRALEAQNGVNFAFCDKTYTQLYLNQIEAFKRLCEQHDVTFYFNLERPAPKKGIVYKKNWSWKSYLERISK